MSKKSELDALVKDVQKMLEHIDKVEKKYWDYTIFNSYLHAQHMEVRFFTYFREILPEIAVENRVRCDTYPYEYSVTLQGIKFFSLGTKPLPWEVEDGEC